MESVASGAAAIESFNQSSMTFDLAIVDLFMPVVDGLEVLRHIKEVEPDFPIIISTGNPLDLE